MKLWNIKLCQSYSSHYSPFMRALGSLMACGGQVGTEKKARVIHPLSFFLEPNTKLPCYFQWFKKCCESVELFVLALIHARNEGTWLWLDIKPCSYWRSHLGAQSTKWWSPLTLFVSLPGPWLPGTGCTVLKQLCCNLWKEINMSSKLLIQYVRVLVPTTKGYHKHHFVEKSRIVLDCHSCSSRHFWDQQHWYFIKRSPPLFEMCCFHMGIARKEVGVQRLARMVEGTFFLFAWWFKDLPGWFGALFFHVCPFDRGGGV